MVRGPRRRDDRGETLVEVLVAVIIIGIASAAILAGIALAVKAADLNRKEANSGSAVRSAAEKISNYVSRATNNYKNCAAVDAYLSPSGVTAAAGYTVTQAKAEAWSGTAWGSCSSDNGLQRVKLSVTFPGDAAHASATETVYLVLRKACNGTLPAPCVTP